MRISGLICFWISPKKAFKRRILNGLADHGNFNAYPFCFRRCFKVGFGASWSHFIYLHVILFRALIPHGHLPAFFYSHFRIDQTSAHPDATCRDIGSRKESTGKENPPTSLANGHFQFGADLKILRTIETFLPYICGPTNQAFQISNRLEERGIHSPVFTTYSDVDSGLAHHEKYERVSVFRFPHQFRIMRYCVSMGMLPYFKNFDILHSHNYRNFQTDSGFFLHS